MDNEFLDLNSDLLDHLDGDLNDELRTDGDLRPDEFKYDSDLTDQRFNGVDTRMQDDKTDNQEETSTSDSKISRPPNAFMIFGRENRKILAKQLPQCTNKNISKLLGTQWRSLTVAQKEHYYQLAEQARREHMAKFPSKSLIQLNYF